MLPFEELDHEQRVILNVLRVRPHLFKEPIILNNLTIRRLSLATNARSIPLVHVVNCWIELLEVSGGEPIDLEIDNSHIAVLSIHGIGFNNWEVRGSSISAVRKKDGSPCVGGDVKFLGLQTPRGFSWYEKYTCEADQWAKLKRDLMRSGNEWPAGIFHATEMSMRSREDPSRLVRRIGEFYEEVCDYGNSVSKTIIWIGFWFVFSLLVYFALDLASPAVVPDPAVCVGWIERLCGGGGWARFGRVVYLAAQPVLNPLAGVMGESVVIPGLPAYMYSVFHRIMSFVLIFLLIVVIRRRFRLTVD